MGMRMTRMGYAHTEKATGNGHSNEMRGQKTKQKIETYDREVLREFGCELLREFDCEL